MRFKRWTMLLLLLPMMLLTACQTDRFSVNSQPVVSSAGALRAHPPLYAYSKAFLAKAATEYEALSPRPCARLDPHPIDCSALRPMISDYHTVRNKLRAIGAKEE